MLFIISAIYRKNSIDENADIHSNRLDQASGTPKSGRLWSSMPQTQLEEMLKVCLFTGFIHWRFHVISRLQI